MMLQRQVALAFALATLALLAAAAAFAVVRSGDSGGQERRTRGAAIVAPWQPGPARAGE